MRCIANKYEFVLSDVESFFLNFWILIEAKKEHIEQCVENKFK